ncbi:hypothetical protein ACHHYP_01730 [Achlya hypogyna]|uniref:PDZ domain-containing protein n=1 Tax=Achlya hypogyna TaxID=1202772 RepID=A0A1V9ZT60_ACHHY|nr:hypothetical protein ACHHYP_01730 [Achlya hypogyna]
MAKARKPLSPWAETMLTTFQLPPLKDDEYFVQWETGRLGVNIMEDKESELPIVWTIIDPSSPLAAAMEVGDYLLCVNELRAEDNTFHNFLQLLTTKQKPVLLRFRRARQRTEQSTELPRSKSFKANSTEKPTLKLSLSAGDARSRAPSRATRTAVESPEPERVSPRDLLAMDPYRKYRYEFEWAEGALGLYFGEEESLSMPVITRTLPHASPELLANVAPNDILVSANGLSSYDVPFSEFFSQLQHWPKPIHLVFQTARPPSPSTPKGPPPTSPPGRAPSPQNRDSLKNKLLSFGHRAPKSVTVSPTAKAAREPQTPPRAVVMTPPRDALTQAPASPTPKTQSKLSVQTKAAKVVTPETPPREPLPQPSEHQQLPSRSVSPQTVVPKAPSPQPVAAKASSPQPSTSAPTPPVASPRAKVGSSPEPSAAGVAAPPAPAKTPAPVKVPAPAKAAAHVKAPAPEQAPTVFEDSDSDDDDEARKQFGSEFLDDITAADGPVVVVKHDALFAKGDDVGPDDSDLEDLDLEEEAAEDNEPMPKLDYPVRKERTTEMTAADDGPRVSTVPKPLPTRAGGERSGKSRGRKIKGRSINPNAARLAKISEMDEQTIPLAEPNSVNMKLNVRGKLKSQRVSKMDTPDSSLYLLKWKENRSIGLQLRECRLAKGVYPMVVLVCREPCCDSLRHVNVGDLLLEINGRDTAMMGVKKTISFVKTCSKTALLKLKRGPGFAVQRVSATF